MYHVCRSDGGWAGPGAPDTPHTPDTGGSNVSDVPGGHDKPDQFDMMYCLCGQVDRWTGTGTQVQVDRYRYTGTGG
jgi:hypothetical protein